MRRGLEDDGYYIPEIKPHSLEKIDLHNGYAEIFTRATHKRWPQRAYIGLYSGAGRARVVGTDEIVETTALSALRVVPPFTKFIFVDHDERCTEALKARVQSAFPDADHEVLRADVAGVADTVVGALPSYRPGRGLLSLCFIDPFSAALPFSAIRRLSAYRMDFLVLLMLGLDARLNFTHYYNDRNSTRIADLIDCADWREQWHAQGRSQHHVVGFLIQKFDEAMVRLGYRSARDNDFHRVLVPRSRIMQYMLVLYTRVPLGQKLWEAVRTSKTDQGELCL